ncbi:MAG: toll/interleukin-1 receptor domain-containing protein [Myxococcota bacterium]
MTNPLPPLPGLGWTTLLRAWFWRLVGLLWPASDFFISYTRQEGEPGVAFVKALQQEMTEGLRYSAFRDETGILTGEPLNRRILQALGRSQRLLVVGTPNALRNRWVLYEIRVARALGLRILLLNCDHAIAKLQRAPEHPAPFEGAMPLAYSRAVVTPLLDDLWTDVPTWPDPTGLPKLVKQAISRSHLGFKARFRSLLSTVAALAVFSMTAGAVGWGQWQAELTAQRAQWESHVDRAASAVASGDLTGALREARAACAIDCTGAPVPTLMDVTHAAFDRTTVHASDQSIRQAGWLGSDVVLLTDSSLRIVGEASGARRVPVEGRSAFFTHGRDLYLVSRGSLRRLDAVTGAWTDDLASGFTVATGAGVSKTSLVAVSETGEILRLSTATAEIDLLETVSASPTLLRVVGGTLFVGFDDGTLVTEHEGIPCRFALTGAVVDADLRPGHGEAIVSTGRAEGQWTPMVDLATCAISPLRVPSEQNPRTARFDPTGRLVLTHTENNAVVHDLALFETVGPDIGGGMKVGDLQEADANIAAIEWTADGTTIVMASSVEPFAFVYDTFPLYEEQQPAVTFRYDGHDDGLLGVAVHPDGQRVLTWSGRRALVWPIDGGSRTATAKLRPGPGWPDGAQDLGWTLDVAFVQGGDEPALLAAGQWGEIVRFDGAELSRTSLRFVGRDSVEKVIVRGGEFVVNNLEVSSDADRYVASTRQQRVLDVGTPGGPSVEVPTSDWVNYAAMHQGGRFAAAAGRDGRLLLYDLTDGTSQTHCLGCDNLGDDRQLRFLEFTDDGSPLRAASYDGAVHVHDTVAGTTEVLRDPRCRRALHATWSNDEAGVLTTCDEGTALLWCLSDPPRATVLELSGSVHAGWFHPTGPQFLTTVYGGRVSLWELGEDGVCGTSRPLGVWEAARAGHDRYLWDETHGRTARFFPARHAVLTAATPDFRVKLFGLDRGALVGQLVPRWNLQAAVKPGPKDIRALTAVAFSRDGRWVASVAKDGLVNLFDLGAPETWTIARSDATLRDFGHLR